MRTEKKSGDTTIEYYYIGNLLIAQFDGTDWLKFSYSADGELIGFNYKGKPHYYIKNQQGDVIALCDMIAQVEARYTYDAWGKIVSVTDANGEEITDPTSVALVNPIRYRGYYYDSETNLYYLRSRYYNFEWGRFFNGDGYASTGIESTAKNMFAYCLNNPVNYSDPTGTKVNMDTFCRKCKTIHGIFDHCPIPRYMLASTYINNTPSTAKVSKSDPAPKAKNSNTLDKAFNFFGHFVEESIITYADQMINFEISAAVPKFILEQSSQFLVHFDSVSSTYGIASVFALSATLMWDVETYGDSPGKLVGALTIDVVGTAAAYVISGAIVSIPGIGPVAGTVTTVFVGATMSMAQESLKKKYLS